MTTTDVIAQSNNCIVLTEYEKIQDPNQNYQTESELEKELIADLIKNGYEYRKDIKNQRDLMTNIREQLQNLNKVTFTTAEWNRFTTEYLNKEEDDNTERSRKVHENDTYTFTFDNKSKKNIKLFDKKNILNNKIQVINQFSQKGKRLNRYDVTILVNGLPLVQIELKRRGVSIKEAFNQTHRYSKDSFNSNDSMFKYLQIFVISNGTESLYFANTTARNESSYDFTMEWAKSNNEVIRDLKDFTNTFLQKYTLLSILLKYSVFDARDILLIMRPYQIAAAERILNKIHCSHNNPNTKPIDRGGYIWHTTGSGKTLTSFKTALLATQLDFIDRVFFVVDRKDLDYQTVNEYKKFNKESVTGSTNVNHLKRNIESKDQKIIVTTIQKLNHLLKREKDLDVYNQEVVFIFDEAHRSQFGEAQRNIAKKFKNYYQFGFTGTPIFKDNANNEHDITANVFGESLHKYVITDAIRDKKVLSFKIDYNNVIPKLADVTKAENEFIEDLIDVTADDAENVATEDKAQSEKNINEKSKINEALLLHPQRISEITKYILKNYKYKTHRNNVSGSGFNAMFAVSSIDAAKAYYHEFKRQQQDLEHKLKIATIFSTQPNEDVSAVGEIKDESFDTADLNSNSRDFLNMVIEDYNREFSCSFDANSQDSFQNYYRDLSLKVKNKEIDLLIVVGMFLTGFDAPTLNTLFVDKNLRYHGLIQAYSRTNRIYNSTKTAGNIVTFRNLEKNTKDAIALFANKEAANIIIAPSFMDVMMGFVDKITGKAQKGYIEMVDLFRMSFPDPAELITDSNKKDFVKAFGEILQMQQTLKNYDEFVNLTELLETNLDDSDNVAEIKAKYGVNDIFLDVLSNFKPLSDREIQDYKSIYLKIKTEVQEKQNNSDNSDPNWDGVTFEVELLKTLEVNLEYILALLLEVLLNKQNAETSEINTLETIEKMVNSNSDNKHRNKLIIDFMSQPEIRKIKSIEEMEKAYYEFARKERNREAADLISSENLNAEEAKRYLNNSLKRGYASKNGTDLHSILPKINIGPLNPEYLTIKNRIFTQISEFVEKYTGVGDEI